MVKEKRDTNSEVQQDQESQRDCEGFVGSMTKEGSIVVACDSKSKLWEAVDLKRAMQNWNMKYVDFVGSPESALRIFTSSGRLANQMNINGVWEKLENLCRRSRCLVDKRKTDEEDRDGRHESWRVGEEGPNG